MKTIIAGSRTITDYNLVYQAIKDSGFNITEIVSGNAKGVDSLGKLYATIHRIPVKIFPANWQKYSRAAGPIRNAEMADHADCLIAIWDGKSEGTKHMIGRAKNKGLKVYIKRINNSNYQPKLL